MSDTLAITLRGVVKRYGSNTVLRGIDLDIRHGEVTCLIGPSGSGKSTLLRCMAFLEEHDAGLIRVAGDPLGFDAARNRLLAARISDIYRRLPTTRADEAPALADEFVAFLHRLLDASQAPDVLDGRELDGGLMARNA